MTVKTHSFNGRRYKITVYSFNGMCDTYNKEREIVILADLQTRNGLVTAIHEALHASSWTASENNVDRTSTEIGRFLWRLGYRLEKE